MKLLALGLFAAAALAAQTAVTNAAVSGMVKDKITGKPLADYTVSTMVNATYVGNTVLQTRQTKDVTVTTDSTGRYRLADLPAGSYRISARNPRIFGNELTRRVRVNGGDVENIDFSILVAGTISGKVVDENKEPIPDVMVRVITREYYLGTVGYHYSIGGGITNDLGEYTVERVTPGQPYFLMAEKLERNLPAHSEVPLDPKLRRRVPVRTWYPASPARDGGVAITLRPGETRDGVDIQMKKSPSYCAEGTAMGPMGAMSLRFGIEATQPSSGISNNGGTFGAVPGGLTGADGQFRICDLYPSSYRLSVQDADRNQQAPNYGVQEITISDEDLHGLRVAAVPGKPLEGEVAWDLDPPATPVTNKVSISLSPLFRTGFNNERGGARADIPSSFTLDGILPDDYAVRAFLNVPGVYVKDVTFSGHSVLYEPLRTATAMSGAGLRVIVAHDGGTLGVQVSDKDGNPGSDLHVLVLPADAPSEGVLQARLVQGQTDQYGQYSTQTLPPGKYYVVATDETIDPTPESIGRLWRARNRFQEVDLPPSGAAQVKIEPGKIE